MRFCFKDFFLNKRELKLFEKKIEKQASFQYFPVKGILSKQGEPYMNQLSLSWKFLLTITCIY